MTASLTLSNPVIFLTELPIPSQCIDRSVSETFRDLTCDALVTLIAKIIVRMVEGHCSTITLNGCKALRTEIRSGRVNRNDCRAVQWESPRRRILRPTVANGKKKSDFPQRFNDCSRTLRGGADFNIEAITVVTARYEVASHFRDPTTTFDIEER